MKEVSFKLNHEVTLSRGQLAVPGQNDIPSAVAVPPTRPGCLGLSIGLR